MLPSQMQLLPCKQRLLARYVVTFFCCFLLHLSYGQQTENSSLFTIENYYRVKWGYAEEFISLWKKNHYPLLKKAKEKGDIVRIVAEKPRLHSGEESRWDFKVTLVFKNSALAFDPNLPTPYKKELYPNQEQLTKEEQHRFELLLAHWDVMTETIPLD